MPATGAGRTADGCQRAVVIGAGPGLGAGIDRRSAREGSTLTLVARTAETLGSVASELRATGARVDTVGEGGRGGQVLDLPVALPVGPLAQRTSAARLGSVRNHREVWSCTSSSSAPWESSGGVREAVGDEVLDAQGPLLPVEGVASEVEPSGAPTIAA